MRILIYSDLHLEFSGFEPSRDDYDVVVLAGDIGVGTEGVQWAMEKFLDVPVIYIFGNHEFYHYELKTVMRYASELTEGSNVHVLENESISIDGVDFLCATLWTDFRIRGDEAIGKLHAGAYMNDFRLIKYGDAVFSPDDAQKFHFESREYLDRSIAEKSSSHKRVIVTHHAPSAKSLLKKHPPPDLGFAFASDMDDFIEGCGAELWIHGHTHESADYRVGPTRVVSNPRGYGRVPNSAENENFDANFIVEV